MISLWRKSNKWPWYEVCCRNFPNSQLQSEEDNWKKGLEVLINEKRKPGNQNFQEAKLFHHILHYISGVSWSLSWVPCLDYSLQHFGFIYFYRQRTKGGCSQLLNWHVLSSRGQCREQEPGPARVSYSILVQLTRALKPPDLAHRDCIGHCVMLLQLKKKKSVDFQTLVLPSCPSSPLDLLQREAKEWRERAIGGTRGRSFRPVLEEAFLTSPHFPHQGSVTGPIYMQGRPGNSTHELRSKGNGIINIFATGTILVGQQRSCWRRVLGTGQVHLSYLLLWDSHLAFPGAPATPWLAGSDPEA